MQRANRLGRVVMLAGMLGASLVGCQATQQEGVFPVLRASLGDGRLVEVNQYVQNNVFMHGPDSNFTTLAMYVRSQANEPGVGGVIARQGQAYAGDAGVFELGVLEARSDATGRHVWLVDVSKRRVVASLDCDTGVLRGIHEDHPAWATVDGGRRLTHPLLEQDSSPRERYSALRAR